MTLGSSKILLSQGRQNMSLTAGIVNKDMNALLDDGIGDGVDTSQIVLQFGKDAIVLDDSQDILVGVPPFLSNDSFPFGLMSSSIGSSGCPFGQQARGGSSRIESVLGMILEGCHGTTGSRSSGCSSCGTKVFALTG
jgi:hypothetical protein